MDYEKFAETVQTIDNTIRDNAVLKTILAETAADMVGDESGETSQFVQDFLDAPLDDKKDVVMQKALSAAMVYAKDKGILPDLPDSGSEIAAIIDDSLTRVKTGYKVGLGILDPDVAVDVLVDHAESRVLAQVDQAFNSGMVNEVITEGIINVTYAIPGVGPVLGPTARFCKPIIKCVVAKAEPTVRNVIKTGIHKVSSTARSVAHSVVSSVKETARSLVSKFTSLFS